MVPHWKVIFMPARYSPPLLSTTAFPLTYNSLFYRLTIFAFLLFSLKVYCLARWIWPKLDSFDRSSLKREEQRFSEKNPSIAHPVRALYSKVTAPSCTVIGNYAPNFPLRSKAHTAAIAPLVLYRTRICKSAMKKLPIANCGISVMFSLAFVGNLFFIKWNFVLGEKK